MKTKYQVTKKSIITTIDFMMAQTGINREQATIAFHTIVYFLPKHPAEPFNKLISYLSRANRNRNNCTMN